MDLKLLLDKIKNILVNNKKIIINLIIITFIIFILIWQLILKKDGKLGEWSEWSKCDKPCGTGIQLQNRTYAPPKWGGKHPKDYLILEQKKYCNEFECNKIDILVTPRGEFTIEDLDGNILKTLVAADNAPNEIITITTTKPNIILNRKSGNANFRIRNIKINNIDLPMSEKKSVIRGDLHYFPKNDDKGKLDRQNMIKKGQLNWTTKYQIDLV